MALVGNTYITLKDKLAQTENGRAATAIVDLLAQSNVLIEDAAVRPLEKRHGKRRCRFPGRIAPRFFSPN